MTSSLPRPVLSVWLLTGLAAACASSNTRREPVAKPQVTAADMETTGDPIEKTLQAKVSGVVIGRAPDGSISVEIRGTSSFYSGTGPLYLVDDVPFQPGPGGALTGVNPHDIESIKVLKNPADTGIYGMRGANGVIVIKTKRAAKRSG